MSESEDNYLDVERVNLIVNFYLSVTIRYAGGGTGIGQATAVEFIKKDYNVVVTGRRKEKLEATVSMCEAEGATKDRVSYIQGETVLLCEVEGATKDRMSYVIIIVL